MRPQHDSQLEMELIPRQTAIGIDSSSTSSSTTQLSPTPSTSTRSPLHFMSIKPKFLINLMILFRILL